MPARKAARVLPEPVGAAIRTSRPAWMAGQPAAWASVGALKRQRNQAWMTGWKGARGPLAPLIVFRVLDAIRGAPEAGAAAVG